MRPIWHQGGWSRNFGDWVILDSMHHHLARANGAPLSIVPVDGHRIAYGRELIAKLNAEAGMLLLGAGGLIFHRPEDGSISGWQFNISLDDIASIRVPIVVYGAGYNRFPYDSEDFPDILDVHLRAVQDRAALFAVRDTGTFRALVERGLDPERMRVAPDPGIFAPCHRPGLAGALDDGKRVIGLNIAGDRPAHRYPPPSEENEAHCVRTLCQALRIVCQDADARVLLLPHIVDVDERLDGLTRETIGKDRVVSLREIAPRLYPPGRVTASLLVGAYAACDLVIGERGHACLIAFGQGRPFFAYGSHDKTRFLLEDIGQEDARFAPEAILAGALSSDAIAARFLAVLADGEAHTAAIRTVLARQSACFDALNRDVIGILRNGGSKPIPKLWHRRLADVPSQARGLCHKKSWDRRSAGGGGAADRAANVRLLVLDFDGVMTDDKVWVAQDGTEAVVCDRSDGLGIEMLKKHGIPSVVISKESNAVVAARCRKLEIECFHGVEDKLSRLERVADAKGLPLEQICFVGNDVPDLGCMRAAGLSVAVAGSHPDVLAAADLVTTRPGGAGAIREVAEMLVRSSGPRTAPGCAEAVSLETCCEGNRRS